MRRAPRREPPFDDEQPAQRPLPGRHDQRLPFDSASARIAVWRPRATQPSGLPDPASWGRRLLIGMVETAGGHRPLHQLAALLSPAVSRGLTADFDRAVHTGSPHWLHRAKVRSIRAAQPATGVAELCATFEIGDRVRAVAVRLEDQHGRWRCTRLQLG